MTDVKYMDLNEFADNGWLQEANRNFFHPLGLAMEVSDVDQDGNYDTLRIWDYREDPEGVVFSGPEMTHVKADVVSKERKRHWNTRVMLFGQPVQPIGVSVSTEDVERALEMTGFRRNTDV